jgi:hypothetical protein
VYQTLMTTAQNKKQEMQMSVHKDGAVRKIITVLLTDGMTW